jgi:hypothetical protein
MTAAAISRDSISSKLMQRRTLLPLAAPMVRRDYSSFELEIVQGKGSRQ